MATQRHPHANGQSKRARQACGTRSEALNARRHEIALADLMEACVANDIDGAVDAIWRVDQSFFDRLVDALKDAQADE